MKKPCKFRESSIPEAKRRLTANVVTNIIVVFVSALIGIWQIPYLIRHLGVEVYGMIPLVISFVAYINLLMGAVTNAVTRFVVIYFRKGEIAKGNIYFNSTLSALIILCGILLIPVAVFSFFFSRVFQVPQGFEVDTGWLCFLVTFSTFVMAVTSPFLVSTFIMHRFDLGNLVKILGRLLRVIVYVICFTYLSVSLKYFGLSYIVMALFILVCSIVLNRRLTPELQVNWRSFSWGALREMGSMSTWMAVNQVGAFLYLSSSFIIINLFMGPEQCGRYAPIALWITLLGALGGAISNVFAPIAFEYVAQDKLDVLVLQMCRSMKFLGLIMGFPIGLLCGFSSPLLRWWLGSSFSELSPLMCLLVGPWIVNITVRPLFSIYRGMNKVKVPALVIVAGGVVNVILAILLIRYAGLGLYGAALASVFCLTGKNLFFTPIYAAVLLGRAKSTFFKDMVPGVLMATLVSLGGGALSRMYDLSSVVRLCAGALLLSVPYLLVGYRVAMNKEDRIFLLSLICKR